MIQEILTYITVITAFVYTIYSFWKTISGNNSTSNCGSSCPSCAAKDLLIKTIETKGTT